MRFIGRDSDGKFDVYLSAWIGLSMLLWAGLMWSRGWGDVTLRLFFVVCGVIPLVLNHTMHGRTS